MREEIRRCKRLLGKEKVRKDDLVRVALSPTPNGSTYFQFPTTYDLTDPACYYRRVIEKRLVGKAERAYWDCAHRVAPRQKAGENSDGSTGGETLHLPNLQAVRAPARQERHQEPQLTCFTQPART